MFKQILVAAVLGIGSLSSAMGSEWATCPDGGEFVGTPKVEVTGVTAANSVRDMCAGNSTVLLRVIGRIKTFIKPGMNEQQINGLVLQHKLFSISEKNQLKAMFFSLGAVKNNPFLSLLTKGAGTHIGSAIQHHPSIPAHDEQVYPERNDSIGDPGESYTEHVAATEPWNEEVPTKVVDGDPKNLSVGENLRAWSVDPQFTVRYQDAKRPVVGDVLVSIHADQSESITATDRGLTCSPAKEEALTSVSTKQVTPVFQKSSGAKGTTGSEKVH